jgi:hypothetical protein
MNLRTDRVILSGIWVLFLALAIRALRIPSYPSEDGSNYRNLPTRLATKNRREFGKFSKPADLPTTELGALDFKQFGAKRTIMRYGPYKVPPVTDGNGMKEFNDQSAPRPCTDCFITKIQAGLEYPNRTIANSDTGMWLHHAVLYDFGRQDLACPNLPYRFFASGNERTRLDMSLNG